MKSREFEDYINKLLSKVYDKNSRILNDIKEQRVNLSTLLLAQRYGVLLEVLELNAIIKANPDPAVLPYIHSYQAVGRLEDSELIYLEIEDTPKNNYISPLEIASLVGSLVTYPFNREAIFYGADTLKYSFKLMSEVMIKHKSLPQLLPVIPKEKLKEYLKQKPKSSLDSKQSNVTLKKSKELIMFYMKYAILNLFNDLTSRAFKNPKTDVFTGMKNAVSPAQVLNSAVSEKILTDLEAVFQSKDALNRKDVIDYFRSSSLKEEGSFLLKALGNNLWQLIVAYPIYTTPGLKEQVKKVTSCVLSERLSDVEQQLVNANSDITIYENPKDICEVINYINIMTNPEVDRLLNTESYMLRQPEHLSYATSFIPPQMHKFNMEFISVLGPAILASMLLTFGSRSAKFIKDRLSTIASKVEVLEDKREDTVDSLKKTLNSLIEKDELTDANIVKNRRIKGLIDNLKFLDDKNPETHEYKELFNKISKSVKAIVSKRTFIER